MDKELKEILDSAAGRYADDVIQSVTSTAYLTPPEREAWRTLLADAYFQGAFELMEVLKEAINGKEN